MLFGDLDRIAQKRRNVFETHSVREQIDRERIPELMRVELYARKLRKTCERTLPGNHAALDLTVPRPEKIFSGAKRSRFVEFFHHKIRQRDIDGNFVFAE